MKLISTVIQTKALFLPDFTPDWAGPADALNLKHQRSQLNSIIDIGDGLDSLLCQSAHSLQNEAEKKPEVSLIQPCVSSLLNQFGEWTWVNCINELPCMLEVDCRMDTTQQLSGQSASTLPRDNVIICDRTFVEWCSSDIFFVLSENCAINIPNIQNHSQRAIQLHIKNILETINSKPQIKVLSRLVRQTNNHRQHLHDERPSADEKYPPIQDNSIYHAQDLKHSYLSVWTIKRQKTLTSTNRTALQPTAFERSWILNAL